MKCAMVVMSVSLALIACQSHAQDSSGPPFNPKNAVRLAQTEKSLVMALESNSPGLQATAAQTVREIKAMVPGESFSVFVIPLMRIVKDEDAQVESRILAALALYDLHSAKGDFAIKREAMFCQSCRLGHILAALAVERVKQANLARETGTKEGEPDILVVR